MKKSISIIISVIMLMQIAFASSKVFAEEQTSTEFENAKIELKGELYATSLVISNITLDETGGYIYYAQITDTKTKPTISSISDFSNTESKWFRPDKIDGNLKINYDILDKYMELNSDMYLWVYKVPRNSDSENYYLLINGYQIEHVTIPSTPQLFSTTTLAKDWTCISLNCPWSTNNFSGIERKMNIKIGKITDNKILNSIKNTESDCFSKLLTYSKTADSIYSNTLTSNTYHGFDSHTDGRTGCEIDLYSKIEDENYYYMYVNLDDEDGKYYPVEGVTLTKADKYGDSQDNAWYMFFYGDSSFNWDGLAGDSQSGDDGKKEDPTVAKDPIPQTGQSLAIAGGIISSVVAAFVLIKKNRDYKEIQ